MGVEWTMERKKGEGAEEREGEGGVELWDCEKSRIFFTFYSSFFFYYFNHLNRQFGLIFSKCLDLPELGGLSGWQSSIFLFFFFMNLQFVLILIISLYFRFILASLHRRFQNQDICNTELKFILYWPNYVVSKDHVIKIYANLLTSSYLQDHLVFNNHTCSRELRS